MSDNFHFYEPRHGHGLPHDPFNAMVGPRPIGWISTQGKSGVANVAPYSFFNAFNYVPPIIGFSSIGYKDTVRNIEETGEFAWNLVTRPLAEQMNTTCKPVGPEVSEFDLAGLTPIASRLINVPRVQGSPVTFECRSTSVQQLKNLNGELIDTWFILGEVVGIYIDKRFLVNGIYDTAAAEHVMRGGGPADYFAFGPEQLFKMYRPR